jgi:putative ABC transport system permease protein
MFLRLLWESFVRQRRRKLLAGIAILLGTTAVTAMLALATTIGDRIHKELAVYGANIVIYPKAEQLAVKVGGVDIKPATGNAYLHEFDLAKLKTIFWGNNITGVSPELSFVLQHVIQTGTRPIPAVGLWFHHALTNGSHPSTTGAIELHPSWKLNGSWPASSDQVAIGSALSSRTGLRTGDTVSVELPDTPQDAAANAQRVVERHTTEHLHITGVVSTGDENDEKLLLPLATAQSLNNTPNSISRVEVSARTKPEDAFARVDPDTLSPAQREIWYCRPYANSIAYQIREAIPGAAAEQIRKVEQSEGTVLSRISGLMWLISAAALLAAGFAVSAAMATAILERRGEIGLMRSLGASKASIALLFYAETGLLAILAGTLGYLFGSGLAAWLGARIFAGSGLPDTTASSLTASAVFIPVLLPVVVATALIVAIAGATPSIRTALRMNPSAVLRADA